MYSRSECWMRLTRSASSCGLVGGLDMVVVSFGSIWRSCVLSTLVFTPSHSPSSHSTSQFPRGWNSGHYPVTNLALTRKRSQTCSPDFSRRCRQYDNSRLLGPSCFQSSNHTVGQRSDGGRCQMGSSRGCVIIYISYEVTEE